MRNTQLRGRPRTFTVAGLAGFGLLCVLTWHATGPASWERPFITAVGHVPAPASRLWIDLFDPVPFVLATLALAGVALLQGQLRLAIGLMGGCAAAVIIAELVAKPFVGRHHASHAAHVLAAHVHAGAPMFPSAHVTAAAAWATAAWIVLGRRSRASRFVFVVPILVGWSVVTTRMHYPADVAGGWLLGAIVVLSAARPMTTPTSQGTAPTWGLGAAPRDSSWEDGGRFIAAHTEHRAIRRQT